MAKDSRVSTWRAFRAAVPWMFLVAVLLPTATARQTVSAPYLNKASDTGGRRSVTNVLEDIAVILWDEPDKPGGKGRHASDCAESSSTGDGDCGDRTAIRESR